MPIVDFLARWEDRDAIGEFVHYGIAVSKTRTKQSNSKKRGRPGASPVNDLAEIISLVKYNRPLGQKRRKSSP
jgi:hypothetical protein